MKFENLEKAKAICHKIEELCMKQQQEEKIRNIVLNEGDEGLFEIYVEKSLDKIDTDDAVGVAAFNLIAAMKMATKAKLLELHNELELL